LREAARPEREPAEHRQQRWYQKHRDGQPGQHGDRQRGAERAEQRGLGDEQAEQARGDGQPGDQHDRQVLGDCAAGAGVAVLAVVQALPQTGQEEDRVVGGDPENQRDEDRLQLGGGGEPEELGARTHQPIRHHVRDPRGEQGDQRSHDGTEVEAHDQRHHRHRGNLHPEQALADQVALRNLQRDRPGHSEQVVPWVVDRRGVRPGRPILLAEARRGVGEQVGHHRGGGCRPAREQCGGVGHRQSCQHITAGAVHEGVLVHGKCPQLGSGLGVEVQSQRVALHHGGSGEQRQPESLHCGNLGGDGRVVRADHPGEATTGGGQGRQEAERCPHSEADERQQQPPSAHDESGVGTGWGVAATAFW